MAFFDLNIPYIESDRHVPDKTAAKSMRLRLTIKAMELGYSGAAFNRTIKGVMSESDRCSIPLFPISSILKLSPAIVSAAKLHRDLLGVSSAAVFRQYTRLTVMVDSPAQASVLNSGNPILKSYDVVAVKPVNQIAFDHACRTSEVDIITIELENMGFRLKQPMVQAAIQRGVYFEIIYSGLLVDDQARRQGTSNAKMGMISNAKLLVNWTRGKNIILSSAAPSVTEFRGPNDVVNLTSLFGLSLKHAKAALSNNCRTLIENALRKKQYHKETIKVEPISSGKQADSAKPAFDDWVKWDPISSGEGDLVLDAIEKFFSASGSASKNAKPIDFSSTMNGLAPHGFQIRDVIPSKESEKCAAIQPTEVPLATSGISKQVQTIVCDARNTHQNSQVEDSVTHSLPTDLVMDNVEKNEELRISERISPDSGAQELQLESRLDNLGGQEDLSDDATMHTCREDDNISSHTEMHELNSESQIAISEGQAPLLGNTIIHTFMEDEKSSLGTEMLETQSDSHMCGSEEKDSLPDNATVNTSEVHADIFSHRANLAFTETPALLENSALCTSQAENSMVSDGFDAALHNDTQKLREEEPSLVSLNLVSQNELIGRAETRDVSVCIADQLPESNSCSPMQDNNDCTTAETELMEDDEQEPIIPSASPSGRKSRKRPLHRPVLFPFKRLVNHRHSKRKFHRSDQF